MSDKKSLLISTLGQERVKIDEKLFYHTFSKIGGTAECFYIATKELELEEALETAFTLKIAVTVFGSGTKILFSKKKIGGLVIKNRTNQIKISGIKGKVGKEGIGVAEALIEADSGVTLSGLNDYLKGQALKPIDSFNSLSGTIGGSIFLDVNLQNMTQKIKVWEEGEVLDIESIDLRRDKQVILSAVFKVKAI